jgi:DNA polymerase sigma
MENSLEDYLLKEFGPSVQNNAKRSKVYQFLEKVILSTFPSSRVGLYGSFALNTYLKSGDIDITVIPEGISFLDLSSCMLSQLKSEFEKHEDPDFELSEISIISATVPTLKLKINSISADITINQVSGISTLILFEELSRLFPANLLKKSIILIKIWAIYFGRIQGAVYGNLSTYALEVLVLFVLNTQGPHSTAMEVFKSFIEFFSKFDWASNVVSVHKVFSMSEYISVVTHNSPIRPESCRISLNFFKNLTKRLGGISELKLMPLKAVNIVDPFDSSNNLAKAISLQSLERLKNVFEVSAEILREKGVKELFNSANRPHPQVVVGNARIPLVLKGKENKRAGNDEIFKGTYRKTQESFRRNFRILLENTQKVRLK